MVPRLSEFDRCLVMIFLFSMHCKVRFICDLSIFVCLHRSVAVEFIPISITIGETDYIDGISLKKNEFYEILENTQDFPKTSQPSPQGPAFWESVSMSCRLLRCWAWKDSASGFKKIKTCRLSEFDRCLVMIFWFHPNNHKTERYRFV